MCGNIRYGSGEYSPAGTSKYNDDKIHLGRDEDGVLSIDMGGIHYRLTTVRHPMSNVGHFIDWERKNQYGIR